MKYFNEELLLSELGNISLRDRCALLLSSCLRVCNPVRKLIDSDDASRAYFLENIEKSWGLLDSYSLDLNAAGKMHENIMESFPEEYDQWGWIDVLVDDAISINAYAIRCLLSSDEMDAMWGLRRAYEAADQVAIRLLDVDINSEGADRIILESPYVQQELDRQARDVLLLKSGGDGFMDVKNRSLMYVESIID